MAEATFRAAGWRTAAEEAAYTAVLIELDDPVDGALVSACAVLVRVQDDVVVVALPSMARAALEGDSGQSYQPCSMALACGEDRSFGHASVIFGGLPAGTVLNAREFKPAELIGGELVFYAK